MMRPRRPGWWTVAVLLLTSGCASYAFPTAQRLYISGKYADIKQYVEAKMQRGDAVGTEELSALCGAYWKLQEYDKLIPCSQQMEQRVQQGEVQRGGWMNWDTAYSFMWGEAFGYIELGEYDQGIDKATHAYEFGLEHRLDPFHQTYSLSALALGYALRGDRINALKYAKLLDEVDTSDYKYQGLGTEKHINLAKVYMALRDYDKALETMQRPSGATIGYHVASNLFFGKPLTGFGAYQEVPRDFMLAKSLLETGHLEEATRHYDALLRNPETAHNNRDLYWMALFDRGRLAEQAGNLNAAIGFYEQAVDLIEQVRATFKTEATKIGFIGDKQTVYHHLIAALFAAARHGKALEYVERAKSRALVDLLASKKEFTVRKGDAQEINAMLKELETLEAQGWIQETGKGGTPRQLRSRTMQLTRLRTKAPQLASLVTVTTVSLPDLQARLSSDETLVEYYAAGEALYAFVLTREGISAVQLPITHLRERVQEFRNAVEDLRSERYQAIAQDLYQQLMKPVEGLVSTPHLILVPHGVLHYLPFGALYDGTRYLFERYHLRYLPSATLMAYLEPSAARPAARAMVIANPELGDRKPLGYAEQEARAVAKAFPESTVLLRHEATETVFKRAGGQFPYLHLATHGVFASEDPLRSGLLLAKDADNDGLLSVEELYSLRLDADLVTLSACETGLGRISNGDELVGLARGFLYAGSRAIVASLWSVDDEATSYLMSEFYAHLAKANTRDALREAQMQTRKRYPHPFYWAAFQLTGQK